ncbi:MAG: helix-turn-helix domain-containing protein [Spirochaetia bacterium]|jgi:excisionase family DNA binding protein
MALSIQQAAAFLGISTSEIYKQTSAKTIPFFKVGKRVLFSEEDLKSWLEAHRVSGEKQKAKTA